ncbi:hypothetical protein [Streptomyces wuyuanensis]|uniref:Uncharacterized protein n=1 Tax=Streptomyces wuyuanensis TaxID=1196353 RepID=A0A1H0EG25_9ACTN|nr:hypothetical protein [Streptomyces wuyuanensis]SDN81437.1 hypothetical protein SAMN05444921_14410 [Streptomyces wuyuanensis]
MTTHTQRLQWSTFNTWAKDRRKARRSTPKARRDLRRLLDQAPAALAAARNKETTMDNYWDDDQAERRQAARLAILQTCRANDATTVRLAREHREGRTGPLTWAPEAATPPQAPDDDGMWFLRREEQLAEARAEHAARKRRADAERQSSERLFNSLRDTMGADAAEEWMNGGDVA